MNEPMQCEWVVGTYESERAKSVLRHAEAGIGYIILESVGRGNSQTIVAAFRRPMDSPLPAHLTAVKDPAQIAKYEKMLRRT